MNALYGHADNVRDGVFVVYDSLISERRFHSMRLASKAQARLQIATNKSIEAPVRAAFIVRVRLKDNVAEARRKRRDAIREGKPTKAQIDALSKRRLDEFNHIANGGAPRIFIEDRRDCYNIPE